ncbi:HVO_2922 family protein [Haloarcula sp. JP-L23]|uniref:HVO_2922 family protein n=1 Tax=Haloarcula sp. JP-L23 TaxID=2716717 RepID=UPI00140EA1C6|nr:DUF1508 domain-containing protein [Haloarcula sp. JP-L23]
MTRDSYEFETTATRAEAAAVLTDVADGILAGSVLLGDGPDAVTVEPPAELDVEVEFETDDDGVSLEVELEWPQSADGAVVAPATSPESDDVTPEDPEPAQGESAAEEERDPGADGPAETTDSTPVGAADGTQSLARFELFRDRNDEWRWRLRHRNGNVVATSGEGYTRKHNARKGLRSVIQNAPGAEVTEESTE